MSLHVRIYDMQAPFEPAGDITLQALLMYVVVGVTVGLVLSTCTCICCFGCCEESCYDRKRYRVLAGEHNM